MWKTLRIFIKNVDKAAEGERADRKNRIVPAAGPAVDLGRRGLKAVEETAASNETGPKEEKEELRDRTCHSCTEKPQRERLGKKMEPPRERGLEPGFLFYPGKGGRTRKEEGSGESSPRRRGETERRRAGAQH